MRGDPEAAWGSKGWAHLQGCLCVTGAEQQTVSHGGPGPWNRDSRVTTKGVEEHLCVVGLFDLFLTRREVCLVSQGRAVRLGSHQEAGASPGAKYNRWTARKGSEIDDKG